MSVIKVSDSRIKTLASISHNEQYITVFKQLSVTVSKKLGVMLLWCHIVVRRHIVAEALILTE